MASLKEIKGRIGSIKNTLKITSAMKLVASAKLHKAQQQIEGMLPYSQRMEEILGHLMGDENTKISSPYTQQPKAVRRVALVVMSSSTSLCGGFNSNIVRETGRHIDDLRKKGVEEILFVPIGRKVAQAFSAEEGFSIVDEFKTCGEKPSYAETARIADFLMKLFKNQEADRIELLYTHYKSMAVQVVTHGQYLPITQEKLLPEEKQPADTDYLIEPSKQEVIKSLLPQALTIKLYAMLLDSNAAEHAARTFAMQQATDNGNALLQELNLMYNKMRQQAITNELLDIVGGSMR